MKLNIFELIGRNCITLEDGQKIYDLIYHELNSEKPVELDFEGVAVFASPFFNAAIGQLVRDIDTEQLNKLLSFPNINEVGRHTLKRVIMNSKQYYANAEHQNAIDKTMQEDFEK